MRKNKGVITKICVSKNRGPKHSAEQVELIDNYGIKDDYHAKKDSDRQVSFLLEYMVDDISKELKKEGIELKPGDFGENFIVNGLDIKEIKIGQTITINKLVKIEVTKIGKDCKEPCIIYKKLGRCIMPKYGIFGNVIKGGKVEVNNSCYCD